jgi:hypothetical protein
MTFQDIAFLYLFGCITVLSLWLIGFAASRLLQLGEWMNTIQRSCINILIGLFISVCIYSIANSYKLNSVSCVIGFASLLWIFLRVKSGLKLISLKKIFLVDWKRLNMNLLFLLGSAYFLIFIAQLIMLDVFSGDIPTGALDFPFYITVSEQLNRLGVENTLNYLNALNDVSIFSAQPYHFFDLWFDATLMKVFPSNHLYVYLFLFVPLFVFFGFISILFFGSWFIQATDSKYRKISSLSLGIVAFMFLFLIGYFPYNKIGSGGFDWLNTPLFNNPKFFYSYFLIGLGIPLWWRKSYLNLSFLFLIVSYCFILYLPITIILFVLILLVERKHVIVNRDLLRAVAFFFLCSAILLLFYHFQASSEKPLAEVTGFNWKLYLSNILKVFFSIKEILYFFRVYSVKVIYFIPFMVLLAIKISDRQHELKKILMLAIIIILVGGVLSFAFLFHIEGWQFLSQLYSPALHILFFAAILATLLEPLKWLTKLIAVMVAMQFLISIVVMLSLNSKYNPTSSKEFKSEVIQNRSSFSSVGLYCISHRENLATSRNISPYLNYYAGFIKLVDDVWLLQASNISSEELDKISPEFRSLYLRSPLNSFISNGHYSFEEGVHQFIVSNGIKFVVWNNPEDVEYLDHLVDRTIEDPQSGYRISFLKVLSH